MSVRSRFLAMFLSGVLLSSCATVPYRVTEPSDFRGSPEAPPSIRRDEPQIERGEPYLLVDEIGHLFFSLPEKLILWNWKMRNHDISKETGKAGTTHQRSNSVRAESSSASEIGSMLIVTVRRFTARVGHVPTESRSLSVLFLTPAIIRRSSVFRSQGLEPALLSTESNTSELAIAAGPVSIRVRARYLDSTLLILGAMLSAMNNLELDGVFSEYIAYAVLRPCGPARYTLPITSR